MITANETSAATAPRGGRDGERPTRPRRRSTGGPHRRRGRRCTGRPGTWTRLLREDTASGRTVPIPPIRAIDTRASGGRPTGSPAIPGQKTGPLKGGTSLTLDLAGIGPIPATATGVIGNLAAVTPSFSGYLAARPSGTTAITTSLNFPAGVAAIANAFTSQLGPAGLTITGSGTSANTYHLVVDITAYIT